MIFSKQAMQLQGIFRAALLGETEKFMALLEAEEKKQLGAANFGGLKVKDVWWDCTKFLTEEGELGESLLSLALRATNMELAAIIQARLTPVEEEGKEIDTRTAILEAGLPSTACGALAKHFNKLRRKSLGLIADSLGMEDCEGEDSDGVTDDDDEDLEDYDDYEDEDHEGDYEGGVHNRKAYVEKAVVEELD